MSGDFLLFGLILLVGLAIGLGLLYLFLLLITAWTRRRVVERIVISTIGTVVRQNLPLAAGLSAAAESETGKVRVQLQRIASLLSQGVLLAQALRFGFPDCSGHVLSLIAAGEQAGQLPAALTQAEKWLVEQPHRRLSSDLPVWAYLSIVGTILVLMMTALSFLITPKFQAIFQDYELELPPITQALIYVGDLLVGYGIVLILMLVVLPGGLYLSFRPRRADRLSWTSRVADWIRWHTPGVRQMEFGRGLHRVLDAVRLAARSGMDLPAAFALAAQIDVNVHLRKNVERFSQLLTSGREASRAAREARLGEVVAVALASAQRTGDLDAALRYAADYHRAILSRWWYLISNLAWPLATLILAGAVAFVVLGLFIPLITLAENTAAEVPL